MTDSTIPVPPLPQEFLALVDHAFAGPLAAADAARLEQHLLHTPGAMAYYLRLAEVDAILPEALGVRPVATANIIAPPPSRWRRVHLVSALAGAAACAAVVAGMALAGAGQRGVPARATRTQSVRWTEGATAAGARLSTAGGALEAGFLELTFDSGVRLLLEGPARYVVTGKNACRLDYGKAFADVPPGAEGFFIDGPRERIIDHGTRFTVDVARDGASTTVGVVSGEVEVRHADKEVRLYTDYALRREGDSLASVPYDKSRIAMEVPGREFPWSLDGRQYDEAVAFSFDVSRLVTGPGDYRAVFKWLQGRDALRLQSVELRLDGAVVARSDQAGVTGLLPLTVNNAPVLSIPVGHTSRGRWELVARVYAEGASVDRRVPLTSAGVVSFESGPATHATARDFVGRWKYTHNGDTFVREFRADGTTRMFINGVMYPPMDGIRYTVSEGVLAVRPRDIAEQETHMLRDDGTLVFLNRPYRNAHRE